MFRGSKILSLDDEFENRSKFYDNIKSNKMVVIPSNETMKDAMSLGMPIFKIIE